MKCNICFLSCRLCVNVGLSQSLCHSWSLFIISQHHNQCEQCTCTIHALTVITKFTFASKHSLKLKSEQRVNTFDTAMNLAGSCVEDLTCQDYVCSEIHICYIVTYQLQYVCVSPLDMYVYSFFAKGYLIQIILYHKLPILRIFYLYIHLAKMPTNSIHEKNLIKFPRCQ